MCGSGREDLQAHQIDLKYHDAGICQRHSIECIYIDNPLDYEIHNNRDNIFCFILNTEYFFMHILMVSAENDALPGAKVGGMGDVVGQIAPALADRGRNPASIGCCRRHPSSRLSHGIAHLCAGDPASQSKTGILRRRRVGSRSAIRPQSRGADGILNGCA